MKHFLYIALAGLYLLHNDFFLWHNSTLIAGVPSGLFYHAAYCITASVLMFLLVRFAWPEELEVEPGSEKLK